MKKKTALDKRLDQLQGRMRSDSPIHRRSVRDTKYLEWIRQEPCIICDPFAYPGLLLKRATPVVTGIGYPLNLVRMFQTEAAHVGLRGLGQKCSDRETIPLCGYHHRLGPDSHHVLGKKFWEHHGLDRKQLIEEFQRLYADCSEKE